LPAGIAVAALAAIAVVAVLAFGGTDDGEEACGERTAAPAAELALLPDGLSFEEIGTITSVEKDDQTLVVKAVTTKPLDEVTVQIQDAVVAAGYRPAGMDNEGDEAEVFFQTGDVAAGQARLEESGCEGQWDIDLNLLDHDAS
jgi:hypothetical protein